MPRDARVYLDDIRQACRRLTEFTRGRNLNGYCADEMLRAAVERQFEIIGEALSQLLTLHPEYAERIAATREIIAFRNQLAHRYMSVDDSIVWAAVEDDVPILRRQVEALLTEFDPEGPPPGGADV